MRIPLLLFAFVCCVSASAAVLAHETQNPGSDPKQSTASKPAPRPPSRWWTSEVYRQELKLTQEQSSEIQRIFQTSMTRMKDDKETLERAQADLRQLMKRSHATERELLQAAERQEMARFLISKERTMMLVRIHSVLTPEQRKGLEAIAKRTSEHDRR